MRKSISTLEEIEAEQAKINRVLKVTEREFKDSLSRNKTVLQDFMLKKVAIPAGAIGLGIAAVKTAVSASQKTNQIEMSPVPHAPAAEKSSIFSGMTKYTPFLLPIIQKFISNK